MRLIIMEKKEQAAGELMKESIFQIKEYIEDNLDEDKLRDGEGTFSLMRFMSLISIEWMDNLVEKINKALQKETIDLTNKEISHLKELIKFYHESSGELFFAPNLFDVALEMLAQDEQSDEISIRNLE